MTADDLCAVLLAHAASLDVRVTKHADNETVLAQIARSTPAALRAVGAEVRKEAMSEMSAAEAAVVARFDAAEPAPESWHVQRVARERAAEELARAAEWFALIPNERLSRRAVARFLRGDADALAADDRTGQR